MYKPGHDLQPMSSYRNWLFNLITDGAGLYACTAFSHKNKMADALSDQTVIQDGVLNLDAPVDCFDVRPPFVDEARTSN